MARQKRKGMIAVAILCFTVLYLVQGKRTDAPSAASTIPLRDLEGCLSLYLSNGWSVSLPPDLPGPYRISEEGASGLSAPASGGQISIRFRDRATPVVMKGDAELHQCIVVLRTQEGQYTYAALTKPRNSPAAPR
jgi:hypothetical protein